MISKIADLLVTLAMLAWIVSALWILALITGRWLEDRKRRRMSDAWLEAERRRSAR